jgi:diadenylate cyclase
MAHLFSFLSQIQTYFQGLQFEFSWLSVIDILLVAYVLYKIIAGLRSTRAMRIVWTLLFLGVLFLIAEYLQLVALTWILKAFFAIMVVVIPVVFQQELRKMLERAGKSNFLRFFTRTTKERLKENTLQAIASAVKTLSSNKTGALMVLARNDELEEYAESGTRLDSDVSEELLLNIFFPKSPLHDGAVIIRNNRIISAGSILPLSKKEKTYKYGTRHRAGLGMSEESDALAIIVSEERGTISLATDEELVEEIKPDRVYVNLKKYL